MHRFETFQTESSEPGKGNRWFVNLGDTPPELAVALVAAVEHKNNSAEIVNTALNVVETIGGNTVIRLGKSMTEKGAQQWAQVLAEVNRPLTSGQGTIAPSGAADTAA